MVKLIIKMVDDNSLEDILYFPNKERALEKEKEINVFLDKNKYYTEIQPL